LARYLGAISYGMYLMHMLTLNTMRRLLPVA
jgi:peptidoglycan/LPS O-acetylase OafA/YrhL